MLSRSLWPKLLLALVVAGGVVWLYEVTVLDSRWAAIDDGPGAAAPAPGSRMMFSATAYCKGTQTASGVNVRAGIAAADPDLLPVGSVIQLDAPGGRYDGVYTVMDTGPLVQGRRLDLYMWSCHEALRFGRTPVRIVVLRLGWNPAHSAPGLVDTLFRRRERAARAAAAAAAESDSPPSAAPAPGSPPEPSPPQPAAPAAPSDTTGPQR
jgi:3D (Asp-Asp-Asp) domain-containing protein